ncbi:hypothetical protein BD626DRAFT_514788 [Schizophyllum amplum]|uniref:YqaE/Pmp3 family membrane protein n=1 Tax=Schizophyllum amplum TaxID=97359 RepID=A0A550BY20_9AGAR|nr:hypothetical protein BD626DRAFT_514788 [Auriculariopsis ampla]
MALNPTNEDLIFILLAILLPPIVPLLLKGVGADLVVNLLLTIFGFYILGIVHALWLVYQKIKANTWWRSNRVMQ